MGAHSSASNSCPDPNWDGYTLLGRFRTDETFRPRTTSTTERNTVPEFTEDQIRALDRDCTIQMARNEDLRRLEHVTVGEWLRHGYQNLGWQVTDLNPEPDSSMTMHNPNTHERQLVQRYEFLSYYSTRGWIEYVPVVAPQFNPDDPPTCPACESLATGRLIVLANDELVCPSCFDDTVPCAVCRENWLPEDMRELASGGGYVCRSERGYSECYDCELVSRAYAMNITTNGHRACDSCINDNYSTCERCEGYTRDSYDGMCESCNERYDDDDRSRHIRSYSYKPDPRFHGSSSSRVPYMGLELEIGTNGVLSQCADVAARHLGGLGYLKSDCSITEHYDSGFEIVTHPMTHEYTLASFPWGMLDELAELGADADDTGIHIHVSRDGFADPDHIYRWLRFMMSNKRPCIKIARRDCDEWAEFREFNSSVARDMANGGRCYRRYEAINVTNYSTFELRMFRGSLEPQEVQAAFDLTHASVEFARDNECYDWHSFTEWLSSRSDTYAALIAQNASN